MLKEKIRKLLMEKLGLERYDAEIIAGEIAGLIKLDYLTLLPLKNKSLLVVKGIQQQQTVSIIANRLVQLGFKDMLVIGLAKDQSLKILDEEQMKKHGWMKIPKKDMN